MSSVLDRVRQLEEETPSTTEKEQQQQDQKADEVGDAAHETSVRPVTEQDEVKTRLEVREEQEKVEPTAVDTKDEPPTTSLNTILPPLPVLDPLPEDTHAPDSPTLSLIAALRQQISILTDQSTELNTKLIRQLERASDLEDNLEHKRHAEKEKDDLITKLEGEKAQWEENMNTGLLVERGTVREEMQRLVEGLVEEEKRRGSAERGREQVEQEINDLTGTLFEQANTMVAAEKYARAQAETRSRQAEENLAAAEAAMRDMQAHLQSLPTMLLPAADVSASQTQQRRYLAATITHIEFTSFIAYIRMLKPQYLYTGQVYPPAPVISNLLSQPFIARATLEDIDPTLRLDTAPDLGWLNRRSVQNAIVTGELAIEPVSLNTLLSTSAFASAYPQDIGCAMCGKQVVVRPPGSHLGGQGEKEHLPPPSHPAAVPAKAQAGSRFSFKPFFTSPSAAPSSAVSPAASPSPLPTAPALPPVYVFRIMTASSTANDKEKESLGRLYPLCASGWCLARLRAVCEWWRFVRTGMIDVIWKGEDGWTRPERPMPLSMGGRKRSSIAPSEDKSAPTTPKAASSETMPPPDDAEPSKEGEKPELPPRKKSGWGLGFGSLGGGKGLGLSKGDTPPQSPSTESQSRLGDNVVVEEEAKGADAPVDTVPSVDEPKVENNDVTDEQVLSEEKASVEEGAEADVVTETKAVEAASDTLAVPKTSEPTGDSDAEEGGNDFSTPKSTTSALMGDAAPSDKAEQDGQQDKVEQDKVEHDDKQDKVDEEVDEETKVEAKPEEPQAVDISSPRASVDITSAAGRPSMDASTVPPTPARSAARRAVPPPPGAAAAPPLPERRARPASTVTLNVDSGSIIKSPILPVTPDMASQSTGNPVTPEPPTSASQATTPQPAPPKLPNRASMVPGTTAPSKTGKRYVEGDSWEAKTWREVVRLKEDMWKARVGLVEGED